MQFGDHKIGLCETNWLTPNKVRDLSITTTTHFIVVDYLNQEVNASSSEYVNLDQSNLHNTLVNYNNKKVKLKGDLKCNFKRYSKK